MAAPTPSTTYELKVYYDAGQTLPKEDGFTLKGMPVSPITITKTVSSTNPVPGTLIPLSDSFSNLKPAPQFAGGAIQAVGMDNKRLPNIPSYSKDLSFQITLVDINGNETSVKIEGSSFYEFLNRWTSFLTNASYQHGSSLDDLIPQECKGAKPYTTVLVAQWDTSKMKTTWKNNMPSSLPSMADYLEILNIPKVFFDAGIGTLSSLATVYPKNYKCRKFLGYSKEPKSQEILDPEVALTNEITTLYAVYGQEEEQLSPFSSPAKAPVCSNLQFIDYTITFNPDGGTFISSSNKMFLNLAVTPVFTCWRNKNNSEDTLDVAKEKSEGTRDNITYVAEYNSYQIINQQGDNQLPTISKDGSTCVGWSITGDETQTVFTDTIVLTDEILNQYPQGLTLKPIWNDSKYTLSYAHEAQILEYYEFEAGEEIKSQTKYPGQDIVISGIVPKVKEPTEQLTVHVFLKGGKDEIATQTFKNLPILTFFAWRVNNLKSDFVHPGDVWRRDNYIYDVVLNSAWNMKSNYYSDIKLPKVSTRKFELTLKDGDKQIDVLSATESTGNNVIRYEDANGEEIPLNSLIQKIPAVGAEIPTDITIYAVTEVKHTFLLPQPWTLDHKNQKFLYWQDSNGNQFHAYDYYTTSILNDSLTTVWGNSYNYIDNTIHFGFGKENLGYLYVYGPDNTWYPAQITYYDTVVGWLPKLENTTGLQPGPMEQQQMVSLILTIRDNYDSQVKTSFDLKLGPLSPYALVRVRKDPAIGGIVSYTITIPMFFDLDDFDDNSKKKNKNVDCTIYKITKPLTSDAGSTNAILSFTLSKQDGTPKINYQAIYSWDQLAEQGTSTIILK